MDGYESDEILSQALDLFEEKEGEHIFLTQSTYREFNENEKGAIFDILDNAIDVSDMLMLGGPSMVGAQRPAPAATCVSAESESKLGETATTSRFKPISQDSVNSMKKPAVPANTLRKTSWAVNLFDEWVSYSLSADDNKDVTRILKDEADLLNLSLVDMNTVLCAFIVSLRKRDGKEYTSGSLFSIATALQKHLEINGRRVAFLSDSIFMPFKNCLDNCMQNVTKQGVGIEKKQANAITIEQENALWDQGILGDETPQQLLYALFWTLGVNFGLLGGDEHRNLNVENFKVAFDSGGTKYLEYSQSISKTYQGGLKHRKIDPHKARAYSIEGSKRCPVALSEKYVSKLNEDSPSSAFYFQPLSKPDADIWYSKAPVGHNKLKEFVKVIMRLGGFDGYFTNHSLRATTATRLFHEHIPEQLIMEQTGHRSNAIYSYKRASDDQKRQVSSVLKNVKKSVEESNPQQGKTYGSTFNFSNSEIHFHM